MLKLQKRRLALHLHLVLLWSDVFISFKELDKIAAVIEAAVISNRGNRRIGGAEHSACMLNTVIVQVVHRRFVGDGLKIPAEIFRRHSGNL